MRFETNSTPGPTHAKEDELTLADTGLGSGRGGLEAFLLGRFSSSEIRRLIQCLSGGERLEGQLIGEIANKVQHASSAVAVLCREDRIDAELFRALNNERPNFGDELTVIAASLSVSGWVES